MSTRTPTRCRDVELRYTSLQLSNNHEPSSEQATANDPHASLAHPSKSLVTEASLQPLSQDYRQLPLPSSPYGLRFPSTKVVADPESDGSSRHPHALELSASLKLTLAQRFIQADAHESDNQSQAQDQEETEDKDEEGGGCEEPHIDDETDGSGNQTQNNDLEVGDGASDSSSEVEDCDAGRRLSSACEPMVHYDDLLSASKPSPQRSQRFFPKVSAPTLNQQPSGITMSGRISVANARFQDCEDDIVNICSPVTSARSKVKKVAFVPVDTIDEPSRNWKKDKVRDPEWTPRQFGQYYELLGFLEHSFATPDDQEVAISSAQLDEMQRLLSSLLSSKQ